MGREDQTEEREVLDSIFPEEITGSSKNGLSSIPPTKEASLTETVLYRYIRNFIQNIDKP